MFALLAKTKKGRCLDVYSFLLIKDIRFIYLGQYARSQIHCINVHAHLPMVSFCCKKVAQDFDDRLGRCLSCPSFFYNGLGRYVIVKPSEGSQFHAYLRSSVLYGYDQD